VVARLRDAGAIILGKTNMPQFGADNTRTHGTDWPNLPSWDGATFNAFNRSIAPGASSSGTATAVSASFAPVGTAGETGGSIQNPAAAQGLVGIKPTFGLIPTSGGLGVGGSTLDVVGPHAKSVYDAALMLDVLAGHSPEDPNTEVAIGRLPAGGYTSRLTVTALEGKRIGLFGAGWDRTIRLSQETQTLYEQAVAALANEGAVLVDDPFAGTAFDGLSPGPGYDYRGFESVVYDFEDYLERLRPNGAANSIEDLREATGVDVFASNGPLGWARNFHPVSAASLLDPDAVPDLSGFAAARQEMRDVFEEVMTTHQLDALVFPQAPRETPSVNGTQGIDAITVSEINILGTPGIVVPAGSYSSGSPFGVIFMGNAFSEAELLSYAYDFEQATLHRRAPELWVLGDFNGNGQLDVDDIELLKTSIRRRTTDVVFDVDHDGQDTVDDLKFWVTNLANSFFGDANLDGQFDSSDLVAVFTAGEYEDTIRDNSSWSTGDWDGDAEFTSSDLVVAFQDGGYEAGPRTDVAAVPEPSGLVLLALGLCGLLRWHRVGYRPHS
jgi:Asp-tRNA(Asn)/Glu-tRNA(Gln) amidotransferase A subunit family amidase